MRPFEYIRADEADAAIALVGRDPDAQYLAGGTTQLDLMLKDGVLEPGRLIDITRLPLRAITRTDGALHIGALTTMEELAADTTVAERLPLVREALLAGASPQLRNMATIGGNVMQRTRCRYFRDPTVAACNKRAPGSGCAAVTSAARMHAILGASEHCIAVHASDLCVSLVALDDHHRPAHRHAPQRPMIGRAQRRRLGEHRPRLGERDRRRIDRRRRRRPPAPPGQGGDHDHRWSYSRHVHDCITLPARAAMIYARRPCGG